MEQNKDKLIKISGWTLFIFAVGFFCLQAGYLLAHERFQVEYIDNRLFYIINILCVICLFPALLLLLRLTKRPLLIVASVAGVFVIVQVILLVNSNQVIKNITSVSPDFEHVFSIKENVESGEAIYFRSYYGILAQPKETLPNEIGGEYKVEWLADDIAAFTYKTADNTVQQFIGTYGDRGSGRSYYYVGPQIHGIWQSNNIEVISNTDGIFVTENGETESFGWDNIVQFGTLAVVLKKNNEAIWTISLDENFKVHSDASKQTVGNISLYKATMKNNQPTTLFYKTPKR